MVQQPLLPVLLNPLRVQPVVWYPPRGIWRRLRAICDEHGILLVFDEVITGFGRLGTPFAAQKFGVTPDIITMAKAITNGCQPMGAVSTSDHVHDTIVGAAPDAAIEFFHGYTFSGHPAACAAGIATQKAFEAEASFDQSAALSDYFGRSRSFSARYTDCQRHSEASDCLQA